MYMDKKEIKEYNDFIRRILEHEDMIRSQRTNCFLVIQGLLINMILIVLKIEDFKFRAIAVSLLLITEHWFHFLFSMWHI